MRFIEVEAVLRQDEEFNKFFSGLTGQQQNRLVRVVRNLVVQRSAERVEVEHRIHTESTGEGCLARPQQNS